MQRFTLRAFAGLVASALACLACSGVATSDSEASMPPLPDSVGFPPRVELRADSVAQFVAYALGTSEREHIRRELDRARGDEAIAAAMLDALDRSWTLQERRHLVRDVSTGSMVLWLMQHLREGAFESRLAVLLEAEVDDAAPEAEAVRYLQSVAAEALACIPTATARARTTELATGHPSVAVRNSAAWQLREQRCDFMLTGAE
ncbi:MAG: hypothetical protein KF894_13545 [Labilithrix sp.]|nr:hypothetical protein [Labilithrix sp.]